MSKRRVKWLLFLAGLAALLIAGRLYRIHVREKWLKPVLLARSEGLLELTLPIISRSCDAHGGCVIETDGLYLGRPTGLTLIVAPNMRPSTFTDRVETTQVFPTNSGITVVSEGPRGRSLLHLLSASFGAGTSVIHLPATVAMTAIPVKGDPAKIQSEPLQFKVVHPADGASGYFELDVRIDIAGKQVQLAERDLGYRAAILKALGAD